MIWVFLQELINIRSKSKTKTALAGLANPSNPHTASCTWTLTVKVTTKTRHRALQSVLQLHRGTPEPVPPADKSTCLAPHPMRSRSLPTFCPFLYSVEKKFLIVDCSLNMETLYFYIQSFLKWKFTFSLRKDSATSR